MEVIIEKTKIAEGLERESSLISVNLTDNSGVSMYDRVFIDNDAILAGAVSEAVSTLTKDMQLFVRGYNENRNSYVWDLDKIPFGISDDILNYIVCHTMNEWSIKALKKNDNSFAGRATVSLQNIARKLYFKSRPD